MPSVLCRHLRGLAILVSWTVLTALTAPVIAQGPLDTDPALVARYTFDDPIGSPSAADSSNNGFTAALIGGAVIEATSRNGIGSSLRCVPGGSAALTPAFDVAGSGLTLATWFRADSFPGAAQDPRLISKAAGTRSKDHVFMLSTFQVDSAVRLRARVRVGGETATLIASSGDLSTGTWYHAALTYDGKTLRLFLNGAEVGQLPLTGSVDRDPAVAIAIGNQPPGAGGKGFDGLLDDTRIYERGLTSTELQTLVGPNVDIPPTAVFDRYPIVADTVALVSARDGVLNNDRKGDGPGTSGQPPVAMLVNPASQGVVTLAPDGSFSYVPVPGFVGTDAFDYVVQQGTLVSNLGTVRLDVAPLPPPSTDLLTHLAGDALSAGVTPDVSGSGNDGVARGVVTLAADSADASGSSLEFQGTSAVDLPALDAGDDGLTLACFLKADQFPGPSRDPSLISKAQSLAPNDHVFLLSTVRVGRSVRLRGRVRIGGATTTLVASSGDLQTGTWHHAAMTYDGQSLRLYLDARLVGLKVLSGTIDRDPMIPVAVGNQPVGAGARGFDGRIDAVQVFARGLNSIEILALENPPVPDTTPPSVVTGLSANAPSSSLVDLSWNPSTDDVAVTGYRVLRDAVEIADVLSGTTFADTTVAPGTTYQYSVVAFDGAGNESAASTAVGVTTPTPDTTPPTAPTNLTAQALSATAVQLDWTASTDLNGVASYTVRRDGVDLDSSPTTTYVDDTAAPETTYAYEVVAVDPSGNVSMPSATVQVTTPMASTDPAAIASYGFEEGIGASALDSTGNGNDGTFAGATRSGGFFGAGTQNDGISGAVDLGGLDVVGSGLTLAMWCRPAGFAVPDGRMISKASGLDADSHLWMLSRINGNQLRFRLRTDAGPTQTLIATSAGLALDQWSHVAATYDGAFMRIFLNGVEAESLPWTGTVATDPMVNVSIGDQPGGGRNFHGDLDEVWILGRALSEAELAVLMTTPITDPAPDLTPPTGPDRVVAYGVSTTRIDLHWTAGSDDDQVSQYRVLRDGTEVGITSALTFRDTGLTAGTNYAYTILAEDPAGNLSAPTGVASRSTLLTDTDEWFDLGWNSRFPVVVDAVGHERNDRLVNLDVDFTALSADIGALGAFDPGSIRVIEVNAAGQVLDASVPFQFDPGAGYDASTNAVGKLLFACDGWLPATARRFFHVYFDTGTARTLPTFANRVSLVDDVIDEGQSSFQVTTANGTYVYHKAGGGFSSLLDLDGNDWISYQPGGGAAGEFRGIPNLAFPEGHFHPGALTSTSTIVRQGPLGIGIHSITADGWECTWDIYPNHARMTVLDTSHPYWFLYEGTPGGALETGIDQLIRASGEVVNTSFESNGDVMGDEWGYFVDPNVGRGLFFANHQDDTFHDTYFPLFGLMTVYGFGRDNVASLMTQRPGTFTIGFLEDPAFGAASQQVRQFFNELGLDPGTPVVRGGVMAAPGPATSVTAMAQSSSEVLLTWAEATDNVGIEGYRVLRDGVEVAFVTGPEHLDTGLQTGTTYAYEIVAVDLQGMQATASPQAQATTF